MEFTDRVIRSEDWYIKRVDIEGEDAEDNVFEDDRDVGEILNTQCFFM